MLGPEKSGCSTSLVRVIRPTSDSILKYTKSILFNIFLSVDIFDEDFDRDKSEWIKQTRGIDFTEARAVWADPAVIEGPGATVDGEERWLKVGQIKGKLWTVGFTMRVGKIRIFMARPAHTDEKEAYHG